MTRFGLSDPPKLVIQMATRSYSMLRIMMTTKLMSEAVTAVAICGVTYSLRGSSSFRSCARSLAEKAKKAARR